MASFVVLREKLRVPDAAGLARERLERPILEHPPTGLDVVVAPAGSGKTTLLARVAAAAAVPVGWYRLTSDDCTEGRLVAYLGAALSELAPTNEAASVDQLLGILEGWTGPRAMLILDDVHEVAGTPAEHALEQFVSLRPPRLQVICGSRRMPDVNVPRIQVSGSYREIGSDDLRFRSWEVEELFATVYRQPLRPEAAAALTRRTGGWAAGLQLFHLATASRSSSAERHRAVEELGGRSKLVRSYLTRNVLADLPETYREFLLRTCALGRLSGEACDALLETTGSHRILEHLETAQLFTSTDDGGTYFRYHEVLQTHLELALVEEYGPAEARVWYLKSAAVLEKLGELRSAARAYAKAGAWISVSRLVQGVGGNRIDATAGEGARLLSESAWQDDPWLALAEARRLVREGALGRAVAAYDRAHALYDEPAFQHMCRHEGRVVAEWLPGHPADGVAGRQIPRQPHWSGILHDAMSRALDPATILAPCHDVRDRLMRALAALMAGEIRLARGVLDSIKRSDESEPLVAVSATLASSLLDYVDGAEVDAGLQLSAIATSAEAEGLPWLARMCHGLEQIVLTASRDAPRPFDGCVDAVRAAEAAGDVWGAAILSLVVGVARQQVGEDGTEDFVNAEARFAELRAPVPELWCLLLKLRQRPDRTAALQAIDGARALGVRGAEVLALEVLAAVAPDGTAGRDAAELAEVCGWPTRRPRVAPTPTPSSAPVLTEVIEPVGAAPATSTVAFTCFGEFRIDVAGEPVAITQLRPQARAVLQLLSVSPDTDHRREFLEEILWPGVDHAVAGHRLQVAVSSIRSLLGEAGTIRRRGEAYRLILPPSATVDVRDFNAALVRAAAASARGDIPERVAAREQALALYTGELLPELVSEHIDGQRGALRRNAAAAAAALASDYRTMGDYERALTCCRRSVDLDPYPEMPWLILADLYEKVGDASSAEHTRREHARVLAELEVSVP